MSQTEAGIAQAGRPASQPRRSLLRLACLLPLAVGRCGSPPPPPAVLSLTIKGSADQNTDPTGHASPVAVHLYQLATTAKFERSDFFALTEREQATLGQDVLASEEVLLAPGETQTITRELKKGTQSVGLVVLFRDIDHAKWRVFAPVAASGPSKLILNIAGTTATLAPA